MSRFHTTFLGYRIYRKKFLGTIAVVLLLSIIVFSGMLIFFVNTWMTGLQQQSQNRFMEQERRLAKIQIWTLDYVNRLYEDARTMADVKALFLAEDNTQYLAQRRRNSLESAEQIRYLPATIKELFLDNRSEITGVTLRSDSGIKALWMENGDIRVSFGHDGPEETGHFRGFGDILAASYAVRDSEHMDRTIGAIDFWVSSSDIYEMDNSVSADWGVVGKDGELLTGSVRPDRSEAWMQKILSEGKESGWLSGIGPRRVFYVKFESSQCSYRYVMAKDVVELLYDNRYSVLVLFAAVVLIAVGVLASSYVGIQTDADFLSTIMAILGAMEGGKLEDVEKLKLPMRHRENEYGMIAVALKDVGMKLKGYIETEYILKLKEQETRMRALQHQINPHFLYNTLETLRSMALTGGDVNMADAIAMLGSLYRARTHKKDFITLREEFELLEMYLKIMSLRFGDNFVYQVELDEDIADMPTVSFWLQPLAENFFTHGFDRESEYNLLIVNGKKEAGGGKIEVIDNGSGIREEMLYETRRNMYEGNDDPEADIGLRNVYMRLSYFYQDGFTMKIRNNPEGGFDISIFIPEKEDRLCTH